MAISFMGLLILSALVALIVGVVVGLVLLVSGAGRSSRERDE